MNSLLLYGTVDMVVMVCVSLLTVIAVDWWALVVRLMVGFDLLSSLVCEFFIWFGKLWCFARCFACYADTWIVVGLNFCRWFGCSSRGALIGVLFGGV